LLPFTDSFLLWTSLNSFFLSKQDRRSPGCRPAWHWFLLLCANQNPWRQYNGPSLFSFHFFLILLVLFSCYIYFTWSCLRKQESPACFFVLSNCNNPILDSLNFLECYFISIFAHKNPKKLRKSLKFKNIFSRVNCPFPKKKRSLGQYGSNCVDRGKKYHFWWKPSPLVNMSQTMSVGMKK